MNDVCDEDDLASLTSAALAGDAEALNTLLRRVRPQVLRYVLARVSDRDSAEDVTQEVAMTVAAALPRYVDTGRPIIAWIFGIAQHKVSETRRALARRRESCVEEMPDQRCSSAAGDPEAFATRSETVVHMTALLATLPPAQAEILRLRVAAGLSAEETAAVMGMTAGAVRVAQHRALTRLRSTMADEVAR